MRSNKVLNTIENTLGRGSQGAVIQTTMDGKSVALKWYHSRDPEDQTAWQEIRIMQRLSQDSSKLFVPLLAHGAMRPVDQDCGHSHAAYAMPLYTDGHLLPFLMYMSHLQHTEFLRAIIPLYASVLLMLKALDANKIIHTDIKPENIMIDGNGFKLADFGTARTYDEYREQNEEVGTPLYYPPEYCAGKRDNPVAAMVWMMGQVLAQALGVPIDFTNELDQLIERGVPPALFSFHLCQAKSSAYNQAKKHELSGSLRLSDLKTSIAACAATPDHNALLLFITCISRMKSILPDVRPSVDTLLSSCQKMFTCIDRISKRMPLAIEAENEVEQGAENLQGPDCSANSVGDFPSSELQSDPVKPVTSLFEVVVSPWCCGGHDSTGETFVFSRSSQW